MIIWHNFIPSSLKTANKSSFRVLLTSAPFLKIASISSFIPIRRQNKFRCLLHKQNCWRWCTPFMPRVSSCKMAISASAAPTWNSVFLFAEAFRQSSQTRGSNSDEDVSQKLTLRSSLPKYCCYMLFSRNAQIVLDSNPETSKTKHTRSGSLDIY